MLFYLYINPRLIIETEFYRVYCEYNYGNEHNFKTPEDRVLHFLSRTKRPGWKWMSLRSRMPKREPGNYFVN